MLDTYNITIKCRYPKQEYEKLKKEVTDYKGPFLFLTKIAISNHDDNHNCMDINFDFLKGSFYKQYCININYEFNDDYTDNPICLEFLISMMQRKFETYFNNHTKPINNSMTYSSPLPSSNIPTDRPITLTGTGDIWVDPSVEKKIAFKGKIEQHISIGKGFIRNITVNMDKRIITVLFSDKTIQMAKCAEGEEFDINVGVAICIAAHFYQSKNKFKKFVKEMAKYSLTKEQKEERKKNKKKENKKKTK